MTEPMSKCELLAAIRRHAKEYHEQNDLYDTAVASGNLDLADQHLEAWTDAYAELVCALGEAETSGLFDELSGYLTASYGG